MCKRSAIKEELVGSFAKFAKIIIKIIWVIYFKNKNVKLII